MVAHRERGKTAMVAPILVALTTLQQLDDKRAGGEGGALTASVKRKKGEKEGSGGDGGVPFYSVAAGRQRRVARR
jgi:hypothetical protein